MSKKVEVVIKIVMDKDKFEQGESLEDFISDIESDSQVYSCEGTVTEL